jgi:hypothetical protein
MPLEPPNLDDRRYQDLFEEMRSLIPRYAPEWTDHNPSDPGITMLQLFAWLGEIIIYRLNRVPDRNYIKFLQLIGVEQKPAVPASTPVTFTLTSTSLSTVIIPRYTRIRAEAPPPPRSTVEAATLLPTPEEPIFFETDFPLVALKAQLQVVQSLQRGIYRDYSEANTLPGAVYPAFGSRAQEGNALLLGFASDNAFPQGEINLYVRVFQGIETLPLHICEAAETAPPPPATTLWEYWDGARWRSLSVLRDETRAFTRSGQVYFQAPPPTPSPLRKARLGVVAEDAPELYWIRCRLARSQYECPPQLEAILTNTVNATAVSTARNEVLGSSNGEPKQIFRTRRAPIYAKPLRSVDERLQTAPPENPTEAERKELERKLREQELGKGFLLEVDEGQGPRPWEEVEDFFNSRPGDRHYILNRTTGDIEFGDGEEGHIPLAGVNNIIARFYRHGGGVRSNVGANTITQLQSFPAGVDTVTNFWPAEGGADEEPLNETKLRAPRELKTRERAVTNGDFELLAIQTPGARIRRAHALATYHPEYPGIAVPGVVTVIVVPEVDEAINWPPRPSEATLQAVCAHLNQRRLLTTELIIAPPKYRQVAVAATLVASPTADVAAVKLNVERALDRYLHPLYGGADGQGWPLGGDVLFSEVFRVVLQVEGVMRVEELQLVVEGERLKRCENAAIPKDYLVYGGEHEINVSFASAI